MTGVVNALRAAWDRYRLATSAPATAWGFQSRWRTVRAIAIHDRCSLDPPDDTTPVVLLHGLAVSHRYLMPLAAELARHHPVHALDLPGFGLSGDPGRVLDVTQHAEHLALGRGQPATAGLGPGLLLERDPDLGQPGGDPLAERLIGRKGIVGAHPATI